MMRAMRSFHGQVGEKDYAALVSASKALHGYMRDYARLSEAQKPLLVSGILIALENEAFRQSYPAAPTPKELAQLIAAAIEAELRRAGVAEDRIALLRQVYGFIQVHPELAKEAGDTPGGVLGELVARIDGHLRPFIASHANVDVVAQFYGEFLRCSGVDGKGLGVVLTPRHITELFCDLAGVTPDSVVLDPGCGTGGFLIAALHAMFQQAGGEGEKVRALQQGNLIGVEQQPEMYALATSNMVLRGDGKTSLFLGNCFNLTEELRLRRPTVGLINPPYSQKRGGVSELAFIQHLLDCLAPNSLAVAIVPMSCALTKNPLKERILAEHTLEAVMSMPDDLFYPIGAITCIMVFRARVPHDAEKPTWFGYWKDDGFTKTKSDGRVDIRGLWPQIRARWLEMYTRRKEIPGLSVSRCVTAEDEWCAEAYMETDTSRLSEVDFAETMLRYLSFQAGMGCFEALTDYLQSPHPPQALRLEQREWKAFRYLDLFEVEVGRGPSMGWAQEHPGRTPYVTATTRNNGVGALVDHPPAHPANTISVNKDGNGTGMAFYHPYPYCGNTHILVLRPKFRNTPLVSLFLVTLIRQEMYRFGFGRAWGKERMDAAVIRLPVDGAGQPDFAYMEAYMRSLTLPRLI